MEPFRLHILGCGSALPTLRHFPTIQVVECRGKLYMVDCGEGAQIQMRQARLPFTKLGHIFISHLHGDHCFGLIGMLSTFGLLGRTATMHVYADKALGDILQQQTDFFCHDLGYEIAFHPIDTTRHQVIFEDHSLQVETLPLEHRMPCCGFLFREKPALPHIRRDMIDFYEIPVSQIPRIKAGADYVLPDGSIVANSRLVKPSESPRAYAYVSDTRFMPQLHEQLKGVTTLYHESTYAEDNLAMAEKYFHSTARQAATVALQASVNQLLLGHYSSRYEDERVLLDEACSIFPSSRLTREMDVIDI